MVAPMPSSRTPSGEPPWQPHVWNYTRNKSIKATHNCYSYMLNDLHRVPRIHGKPQPGAYANLKMLVNRNVRLNCDQIRRGVEADNPHMKVLSCKQGLKYRCKPGFYKGFMMIAPGVDFHFARQDNRMIGVYRKMHKDLMTRKIQFPTKASQLEKLYLMYIYKTIPNILKLAKTIYPNACTRKQLLKAVFKSAHIWSHKPGGSNATDKDASNKYILNPLKADWNFSNTSGINYTKHCCFFEIPSNYTSNTYSTGYSFTPSSLKNSPANRIDGLSKINSIDQQYESVLLRLL